MLHYVARRLVAAVPTLLGVSIVVFMMVRLLPGDPARIVAGLLASEADVEHIRHQLGLDQPGLVQYAAFLGRLAHFVWKSNLRLSSGVSTFRPANNKCPGEPQLRELRAVAQPCENRTQVRIQLAPPSSQVRLSQSILADLLQCYPVVREWLAGYGNAERTPLE